MTEDQRNSGRNMQDKFLSQDYLKHCPELHAYTASHNCVSKRRKKNLTALKKKCYSQLITILYAKEHK